MNKKHIGSNFDDFLKEEKTYEQAQAAAIKRVVAYQITEEMKKRKLTKTEMASRMKTSRSRLSTAQTSAAATRCPWWTGSNVPP